VRVNVERQPGSVVELSIEVPTEQVEGAIERAYQRLAPRVKVSGFRPGRAPRPIIERQIGWPALRAEALDLLLPEAVGQAVDEGKLQAIDTPEVEIQSFERLQPARFRARVTVKPEVKLGGYRQIRAALEPRLVTPELVDETLEELRRQHAQLVPADDRAVRDGDHLVVDLQLFKDGSPVEEQPGTDMDLHVDRDSLIEGLFQGVEGMRHGEQKEIPVRLPENYHRKELAGGDAVFRVTVKSIKEQELPPLDDELARTSGMADNLQDLRVRVEERLRVVSDRDAAYAQQKAALDALVGSAVMEVPDVLVEDELDREVRNLAIELAQQGIDFERLVGFGGFDLEKMRRERREPAAQRVREELALDALALDVGLEPSAEHVEAEIDRALSSSPDRDRLKASERVRSYVTERLRLQWALLWLAASARGEAWTAPLPGSGATDAGEMAAVHAAGEIVGFEEREAEPLSSGGAEGEGGMVEV